MSQLRMPSSWFEKGVEGNLANGVERQNKRLGKGGKIYRKWI